MAATFKDTTGREWSLVIDVYQLDQVEQRTGVQIDALLKDNFAGLEALFASAVRFVRVLWVLVEEQAEKKAVKPEQFGRSLGGDALEDATAAFMKAFADFCPRRQRTVIEALTAKTKEVAEKETATFLKVLETIDPDPSSSATSSPASSESIPLAGG